MNFTRDSLGKNMGFSRERHEKHMGKTWDVQNCGKNDVGFYVGGRDVTRVAQGLRGCFRRGLPQLDTHSSTLQPNEK